MNRWKIVLIAVFIITIATLSLGVFFVAPRTTYPVYLHPMPGAVASIGAPVYRFGTKIGYVHAVELSEKYGPSIELHIYDGMRLYESDVCVIHRLHRYDEATGPLSSSCCRFQRYKTYVCEIPNRSATEAAECPSSSICTASRLTSSVNRRRVCETGFLLMVADS